MAINENKLNKLEKIKELNINPYPYSYKKEINFNDLKEKYNSILAGEETEDYYKTAGRIKLIRNMGGMVFITLQDEDENFQAVFIKKELKEKFKLLKLIDIGDIIGIEGFIFKTKKGELSLKVKNFEILSKSLVELGDKYHGIKEIETKYRNRSLDMIMNPETRKILKLRFIITQKIREFMIKEGFLEVETPILQVNYGGAAAKPFITHHNELDMDLFLRVSPEQSLKKILVGGMEAIFEINKNFRNESIDRTHNPEFTMLEAYKAYVDYNYMISLIERLTEFLAKEIFGKTKFKFKGEEIDLKTPWRRIPVIEALEKATGWNIEKMTNDELFDEVKKIDKEMFYRTRGEAILLLFEEYGEKLGIQPTHFIDYPKESTVFCKSKRNNNDLIERFETFIGGIEIANAYSELNDPILQRKYLEEQDKQKKKGNLETWGTIDESFLEAMELGMPPAGGIGIGIDRLSMILLEKESIRDTIYFPTMKPKKE